ncbi:hypothetical protein [Catenulispora pinisilvae]|uniref:hypothetical protein n=1 Tax=Catenulispora pinisilvae TaxID=2705253 RepID=UPI00189175D5|nr:hypothetical protein [Catenulispora pinisilvae]
MGTRRQGPERHLAQQESDQPEPDAHAARGHRRRPGRAGLRRPHPARAPVPLRLVSDRPAPARAGGAAVAAANDADATFAFDENDAAEPEFLAAAGWRKEHDARWTHPDGRVLQARIGEGEQLPVRIGRDDDPQPIRASQHVSIEVLHALTADAHDQSGPEPEPRAVAMFEGRWQPTSAEIFRRMFLKDIARKFAAEKAEADTFAVPPGWADAASASERGQQHIRLALAMTGIHAALDSPELFDRVADTIPAIIADLHALARRIGLDPQLPGPPPIRDLT